MSISKTTETRTHYPLPDLETLRITWVTRHVARPDILAFFELDGFVVLLLERLAMARVTWRVRGLTFCPEKNKAHSFPKASKFSKIVRM
jgi:hypothetical protein